MDDMNDFEQQLSAGFRRLMGPVRPVDDAAILAMITATRSRGPRLQGLFGAVQFAVTAVIVALFAGLLLVVRPLDRHEAIGPGAVSDEPRLPPVTGPAGNGLIAYERDGDIYVGDPVSGMAEAIVSGPVQDGNPVFSPDGTRIAFRRANRGWTQQDESDDHDIVVVRTYGSDERVITPEGFSNGRVYDFAWLPDSASLVVHHFRPDPQGGFIGELSVLDADGLTDPRRLPLTMCGQGFYCDVLAGMFRPPEGDRVLFSGGEGCEPPIELCAHPFVVMDPDGGNLEVLIDESRMADMGIADPTAASWSPDGSMIAFQDPVFGPNPRMSAWGGIHYVMNADGTELRRLGQLPGKDLPGWSPDGSRVAYDRLHGDRESSSIVIVDVATGVERDLEATAGSSELKTWSPDGQSILYAVDPGDETAWDLFIVDVETGVSTELPWKDAAPSWQRVALPGDPERASQSAAATGP
jgi:dipeptidyl aminopeptidase/acylaminoacyl peptidase